MRTNLVDILGKGTLFGMGFVVLAAFQEKGTAFGLVFVSVCIAFAIVGAVSSGVYTENTKKGAKAMVTTRDVVTSYAKVFIAIFALGTGVFGVAKSIKTNDPVMAIGGLTLLVAVIATLSQPRMWGYFYFKRTKPSVAQRFKRIDKLEFSANVLELEDTLVEASYTTDEGTWPNYADPIQEKTNDTAARTVQGVDVDTWGRDGAVPV